MVQLLAGLGLIAVCLTIGVRLLWLARRTRGLPEVLIGASFALAGGVASILNLVRMLAPVGDAASLWLGGLSNVFLHAGIALLAAFTWRVFRPEGGMGAGIFGLAVLGLAVGVAGEVATARPSRTVEVSPWLLFSLTVRTAIYAWTVFECLSYWTRLRRRARIGLADPLVVNRILLWATGTSLILVLWLRTFAQALRPGANLDLVGSPVTTALVLACAIVNWLAFFPPEAYRRWFLPASPTSTTSNR